MKAIHAIAFILVIIGALNWLVIGLGGANIVEWIVRVQVIAQIIYILVGISAIILVATHKKDCKCCDKTAAPAQM